MKYTRLIVLTGVAIIIFVGAAVAYNQLSGKSSAVSTSVSSTSDLSGKATIPSDTTTGDTGSPNTSTSTTAASTSAASTSAATTSSSSSAKEGLEIRNLAYDFSLKNYDGDTIALSSLRGKVVILNFWASWCSPCQLEMPGFQNIQDGITAKGADADTTILTVNMTDGSRETRDTAHGFLEAKGYTFPTVFDEDNSTVARLYQIYGIPATYILDKNGVIVQTFLGAAEEDKIQAALDVARQSVVS